MKNENHIDYILPFNAIFVCGKNLIPLIILLLEPLSYSVSCFVRLTLWKTHYQKLQFCKQTIPLTIHVYAQDEVSS